MPTPMGPDELTSISADLGVRWETSGFSMKAYPAAARPHVDRRVARHPDRLPELKPDDIESIQVACSTLTAKHVGWPYVPDR